MEEIDFSASSPQAAMKNNHSPAHRRRASQYVRTSGNSFTSNKTMDLFIPNVTKTPERNSRKSNRNNHEEKESNFFASPVQQPSSPRQYPASPRVSIDQTLQESNLQLGQKSKSSAHFNLRNYHKSNSLISPNFNDLHNFNNDLSDQLTINKLQQIFDEDLISLANFNILLDKDQNCRIHPEQQISNRNPSENLLLKHELPQVSLEEKVQTKYLVHTINEAITKTRELNGLHQFSLEPEKGLLPNSLSLQQIETEADIWLSTLNECIKATKSKMKSISLVYLVAQRSLRDLIKRLISTIEGKTELAPQQTQKNEEKEQTKTMSLQEQLKMMDKKNDDEDIAPIIGALKRDIEKLESRNRSLLAEQFDLKSEVTKKDRQAEQLLEVNLQLRQTISETEHRLAASTLQAGSTNEKTNLGIVPTETQMVWGELTQFIKDMNTGLKRINIDKLLPTFLEEITISVPQPGNNFMSPQKSIAESDLTLQPRQRQRRRTMSFVNNNMITYNLDLHDLATMTTLPISKTDDNKQNQQTPEPPKSFRTMTKPDMKLHFSYFLNDIAKFTETCPGSLKCQPASSIYSHLENDLKHLLSMISAKYRERLLSIRNDTQTMKANYIKEIKSIKNEMSDRSLWVRCMLQNDDLVTIPKEMKISDDYKSSILIVLTKMLEFIKPVGSEAFMKQFPISLDKNLSSIRPKMASEAFIDSFPKAQIEKLIEMIAFINKSTKIEVTIDYLQKFLINELPYQHFPFFCSVCIASSNLMKLDSRSKPQMVSRIFNIYGYTSALQAKDRQSYEYTYLNSPSLYIVFMMSLYEHVIEKLKNHVISKFNEKAAVESSLKFMPQKFYSDFIYTLTTGLEQSVTNDLVEYLTSISGENEEIGPLEVAVAMFNYGFPLENALADFSMEQQEEGHMYITIYQENEKNKTQKAKKGKSQKIRTIESIKAEDL